MPSDRVLPAVDLQEDLHSLRIYIQKGRASRLIKDYWASSLVYTSVGATIVM